MENLEPLGPEYWWLDDINTANIPNADVAMYSIDSPYRGVRENCDTRQSTTRVCWRRRSMSNVTITGAVPRARFTTKP